jgi:hypothetical protein
MMDKQEVIDLMRSSNTEQEWNANCSKIKKACGNAYPPFWFRTIILSGLGDEIAAKWGGDTQIRIETI